jgi:aldehyde dehydrogenase (NAD+)
VARHARAASRRGGALCAEALRRHKDALGSLVSLEMGKIKAEGDGEVQEMIDIADFAVGLSRMLYGRTMHSERPATACTSSGIRSASSGSSALQLPRRGVELERTDRGGLRQRLCLEAFAEDAAVRHRGAEDLQRGAGRRRFSADLQPVRRGRRRHGGSLRGRRAGGPRVLHRLDPVGRQVAQRVAARLGRSLLELGGNNAMIVDEKANLELGVPAIVFGAVGTAGQRCTTTRRVLVHEKLFDERAQPV